MMLSMMQPAPLFADDYCAGDKELEACVELIHGQPIQHTLQCQLGGTENCLVVIVFLFLLNK